MASPTPKPSLAKTWAVFGATSILLFLVSVMGDHNLVRVELWQMHTRWFSSLLFGALGVTFAIQLVHCTALSSFWPSLVISLLASVIAALSFANQMNWGAGLGLGILGASCFIVRYCRNGKES